MARRALSGFVLINILISLGMVFLAMYLWDNVISEDNAGDSAAIPATRTVILTATPRPGELPAFAYEGTIDALEAQLENAGPRTPNASDGDNLLPTRDTREATPTINSSLVPAGIPSLSPDLLGQVTVPANISGPSITNDEDSEADDGCERYIVEAGDTCIAIAEAYDVDLNELIILNDLDANCVTLREAQTLRIPGPSCSIPPTATSPPSPTNTPFAIGTFSVTNTPVPTAVDASVQIVNILNFGDPTSEQVDIENAGEEPVNLQGWTLRDSEGNIYTFPDVLMQPGQRIRVFTRSGNDTPAALFWGQTLPIWGLSEQAVLSDSTDEPQSVFTVGGEAIDFGD